MSKPLTFETKDLGQAGFLVRTDYLQDRCGTTYDQVSGSDCLHVVFRLNPRFGSADLELKFPPNFVLTWIPTSNKDYMTLQNHSRDKDLSVWWCFYAAHKGIVPSSILLSLQYRPIMIVSQTYRCTPPSSSFLASILLSSYIW